MKTLLRISTLSLGILLLVGCASTRTAYRPTPPAPGSTVTDDRYVAIVEHVAKQRGAKVMWVHPPTKKVPEVAVVE